MEPTAQHWEGPGARNILGFGAFLLTKGGAGEGLVNWNNSSRKKSGGDP